VLDRDLEWERECLEIGREMRAVAICCNNNNNNPTFTTGEEQVEQRRQTDQGHREHDENSTFGLFSVRPNGVHGERERGRSEVKEKRQCTLEEQMDSVDKDEHWRNGKIRWQTRRRNGR
jgi:hypothetical protein